MRPPHLTPDRGLLVVPGDREGDEGIDSYVHTVAYNGLALWSLAVAAERAATLSPRRRAAGARELWRSAAAARDWRSSAPGGRGWRCGRSAAAPTHDLRYGFGLLALKVREGGLA